MNKDLLVRWSSELERRVTTADFVYPPNTPAHLKYPLGYNPLSAGGEFADAPRLVFPFTPEGITALQNYLSNNKVQGVVYIFYLSNGTVVYTGHTLDVVRRLVLRYGYNTSSGVSPLLHQAFKEHGKGNFFIVVYDCSKHNLDAIQRLEIFLALALQPTAVSRPVNPRGQYGQKVFVYNERDQLIVILNGRAHIKRVGIHDRNLDKVDTGIPISRGFLLFSAPLNDSDVPMFT
jgi:hypothetical protein